MSVTLHTNYGDIKLEVFCEEVPKTAYNFMALAASGYYDNTIFHRNIKGFMIQLLLNTAHRSPAGASPPPAACTSAAGRKFPDEVVDALRHHKRGIVSMANSGPNTNGSQFFITYRPQAHLNGKYSVFAQVIDGQEVLDKLEASGRKVPTGANDRPLQEIRLNRISIHANPLAN
eukprot:scaffold14.g1089.t1